MRLSSVAAKSVLLVKAVDLTLPKRCPGFDEGGGTTLNKAIEIKVYANNVTRDIINVPEYGRFLANANVETTSAM